MKSVFVTAIILFSIGASSSEVDSYCLKQIATNENWAEITPSVFECMNNKFAVNNIPQSLSGLCTDNNTKLSPKYQKYLDYEAKETALKIEVDAETDPTKRHILLMQLNHLENEWIIFGFKSEISGYLWELVSTHSECTNRNIKPRYPPY